MRIVPAILLLLASTAPAGELLEIELLGEAIRAQQKLVEALDGNTAEAARLEKLRRRRAAAVERVLKRDGTLPKKFVGGLADLLGTSDDKQSAALALRHLRKIASDPARILVPVMRDVPRHRPAWDVLHAEARDLYRTLTRAWWTRKRPGPKSVGHIGSTTAVGGGGERFREFAPNYAALTGLRYRTIEWAGHTILRSLQGLYGKHEGETFGTSDRKAVTIRAPEGYAVGGLVVKGGHRVDGFAVIYLRVKERGSLDRDDVRISTWQGGRGGGPERILAGRGNRVVGIHGRAGADVDALGLLVRNPHAW